MLSSKGVQHWKDTCSEVTLGHPANKQHDLLLGCNQRQEHWLHQLLGQERAYTKERNSSAKRETVSASSEGKCHNLPAWKTTAAGETLLLMLKGSQLHRLSPPRGECKRLSHQILREHLHKTLGAAPQHADNSLQTLSSPREFDVFPKPTSDKMWQKLEGSYIRNKRHRNFSWVHRQDRKKLS